MYESGNHYASSNPTKHKRLTLIKLRTSISVHWAMHRAALGHLPLLRLAMHTLILLSKFKQRTKNDTKKYGRKTHAVPIPVVPFRFFPGTTRLPVLVVHFFCFPKQSPRLHDLPASFFNFFFPVHSTLLILLNFSLTKVAGISTMVGS